jgi:hypothetical protein
LWDVHIEEISRVISLLASFLSGTIICRETLLQGYAMTLAISSNHRGNAGFIGTILKGTVSCAATIAKCSQVQWVADMLWKMADCCDNVFPRRALHHNSDRDLQVARAPPTY